MRPRGFVFGMILGLALVGWALAQSKPGDPKRFVRTVQPSDQEQTAIAGGGPKVDEGVNLLSGLLVYYGLDGASAVRADNSGYLGYDYKGPGYAGHTLYPSAHTARVAPGKVGAGCVQSLNAVVPPYDWDSSLDYTAALGGDIAAFRFAGDMTFALWSYPNGSSHPSASISHGFVGGWVITDPGSSSLYRATFNKTGGGTHSVNFGASYPSAAWHHFLVTYTEATKTVATYMDGAPYTTSVMPVSRLESAGTLFQIAPPAAYIGGSNGADEVGVWTRVLNAAEIAALYNSGAGRAYSSF